MGRGSDRCSRACRNENVVSWGTLPVCSPAARERLVAVSRPRHRPLAREAEAELHRFDAEFGDRLTAYGPILLRSEAASSSQIENLTAAARQIFTAELGGKGARNAAEIAANTRAMISALDLSADLSAASICEMHRALMAGQIRHTPGQYRTEPVWIGTRADSPLGASYVAPDHARVPELMDDLSSFAQRDDIPGLIHVSVAHAQFETIHPFTDGNGRTGRALAQAMLRRHQITRNHPST